VNGQQADNLVDQAALGLDGIVTSLLELAEQAADLLVIGLQQDTGYHPRHSVLGIIWTAVTAVVMFALAWGVAWAGRALGNPVLRTEGRVTMVDGILAAAVLLGLVLNAGLGWWWADPAAG
jgi:divalent metal cation (Fe/Co/Zn/Cd) transporter